MASYVLDTSALLAYIENEAGANEVEEIVFAAAEGKHVLFVSIVTSIELFYVSLREQGKRVALERLEILNALPLSQEVITNEMVATIGELKAAHQLSFADCCVAGLAIQRKAILIHKDPEYEQLREIAQLKLAYKDAET